MKWMLQLLFTLRRAWLSGVVVVVAFQAPVLGAAEPLPALKLDLRDTSSSRDTGLVRSVAPVVKKVAPSVVNIYSTVTVHDGASRLSDDPFFRHFFGDNAPPQTKPRSRHEQSLGSGVIVSHDGYILTANHVVEGAEKVKVALASGDTEFDAQIVGMDAATDTAVLKVDATNLPAATIADSDKLEVGDMVLAIGNPFAVGQTVTLGIVSALGRGGFNVNSYEDFIQTDAAINPGNSGGALVDAEGRLVGINTWIISRTGGFQGLGFAVPINMARYVMERLIRDGKVTRGYLGLWLQPEMSPELAKQFSLPTMSGALVTTVDPNSPAAKAGFKQGDFVTDFDGQKVKDMRHMRLMVSETAPGMKVTMKILRDGQQKTLSATLGELPREAQASPHPTQQTQPSPSGKDALDGVDVTDLNAQVRREVSVPAEVQGALVTNVKPDSNAADAGLQAGDVIVEIDRKPVKTADKAVTFSEKANGDRILLRIWRGGEGGGGMLFLSVDNIRHK
jgi:serine protease Do